MGVLTTLLTLPLAPVRGVLRLADALAAVAEDEMRGDDGLRDELRALEEQHDAGLVDDAELERRWDAVMERLARTGRGGAD